MSRSGRLAQLPAIAEDSQAAAPAATPAQLADDSLSGPSRATVPAAVLKRGLRGALEAQRGLQAGRKRREKLLRALGKVMPVCTLVDLSHATSSALHSMCSRGGNERRCAGEGELAGSSTRPLSNEVCPAECIVISCQNSLRLQGSVPTAEHERSCMHGQAVEVRGYAQQQTEQLMRVRGGARRQRSAAERAQRVAAALQRSLALSRQVAVMQAQALAAACAAMLVTIPATSPAAAQQL